MPINITVRGSGTIVQPVPIPRHGIANGFRILQRSAGDLAFELDQIQAVGAKIIRVDLLDSTGYQTAFGLALSGAEARGLQMIACLRGSSGPADLAYVHDYSTRMAQTWGSRIACWEYVNEPNLGGPRYVPATYASELIACYDAVKAVLPSAFVVNGGLGWDAAGKFSNWWPGVIAGGARGHFDALNLHLYMDPGTYLAWSEGLALDSDGKPVIVTESGASVDFLMDVGGLNLTDALTEQAAIVTDSLNDNRVASLCIYTMMNDDVIGFGLLNTDRTQRPAWAAYAAVA